MRRGLFIFIVIIFVFSLFLLLNSIYIVFALPVDISGKATSQANLSVSVENGDPTLSIFDPIENRTYRNESILLNYSVFDPEGISLVWYNIDDGNNVSIGDNQSGYIYFNTSEDSHTLYLFANDTYGLSNSTSVDFFANNTAIIVIYETFRGDKRGNSTDFDSLIDEELENLSNMTLEHIDYGKILWNQAVNITSDTNANDRITTLDYNVTIGDSFIFVNETELPNLDKQATLWFYDLAFTNPRILKDGVVCPSSICTNQNYANGIFSVDVSSFTNYSLEETPTALITPEEPGDGRRYIINYIPRVEEKDFSLSKNNIRVSLKQGETKEEYLEIANIADKKLDITIDIIGIEEFVEITEKEFVLESSKTITLNFITTNETLPGVYMGKILVKTDDINREVLVRIDVISAEPLFKIEVPEILKTEYIVALAILLILIITIIILLVRRAKKKTRKKK